MANFLLLLHQTPGRFRNLSPERSKILGLSWRDALVKRNKMRAGEKLTNDGGRHLRAHDGKISVTDGPFSESQEVLGSFFVIEAADYGRSRRDRRTYPHLGEGRSIEVRQVDAIFALTSCSFVAPNFGLAF